MSGTKNQVRTKKSPKRRGGATKRRRMEDILKESAWSEGRSGKPVERRVASLEERLPTPLSFQVVASLGPWIGGSERECDVYEYEMEPKDRAVADALLANGCRLIFHAKPQDAVFAAARIANQIKQRIAIEYMPDEEALILWGWDAREDWPEYEGDGK